MKFVSYAQNFEDVMLWRALAHVEHGCYVDIGAQDPVVDSVSKAFYERGWRGVHVEPVPAYANALRAARPDETVLQVALAETDGTLELNVIADTGLSTAVEAYAERHEAQHGFASQTMQVPALTMKSALAWLSGRQVHWLKIDVEGLEERVLRGWDSTAIRPWIMVVEATIPNSRQTDFSRWEPILLKARYQFAYFDGLNRFYVAAEHAELMEAFSAPPNVFDEAQLSGLASSELCRKLLSDHAAELVTLTARQQQVIDAQTVRHQQAIDALTAGHRAAMQEMMALNEAAVNEQRAHAQAAAELNTKLRSEHQAAIEALSVQFERGLQAALADADTRSRARIARLDEDRRAEERRLHAHIAWQEGQLAETQRKVDELNQSSHHWWMASVALNEQIDALHASASWRISAPLRFASRSLRWLMRLPRRSARYVLRRSLANPGIKNAALRVLRMAPGVEARLRQVVMRSGFTVSPALSGSVHGAGASAPLPHHAATPVSLDEQLAQELSPRARVILEQFHQVINLKVN